jgi:hypothetical protein
LAVLELYTRMSPSEGEPALKKSMTSLVFNMF